MRFLGGFFITQLAYIASQTHLLQFLSTSSCLVCSVETYFQPDSFPILAHGISNQETKELEMKTCNGFKTTETLETLTFMKNYTCSLWAPLSKSL